MENIINKKVTVSLWKLIAFITFTIGFITLGIATENIVVSNNFIIVAKIITVIVVGTIITIKIVKLLLNKIDSIREFVTNHINYIIIGLIVVLIANLVFGIVHQINIGAMSESVLILLAKIGILTASVLLIISIINMIKLIIDKKKIKREARMRKLASIIAKTSNNVINDKNNNVFVKALVTDLYSLSVQDVIVEKNMNPRKLYKSEKFMSLLNETVVITKELGVFQASFDLLVKNKYISAIEAATAKVVTFYVDREVLSLL